MRFTAKFLLTAAPAKSMNLDGMIQEFLSFLDPQGVCPKPSWKWVNKTSTTLGLCTTTYKSTPEGGVEVESKLEFQKNLQGNEHHLRSVVAHEVCHHVAHCLLAQGLDFKTYQKLMKTEGMHGPEFFKQAERINSKYGKDFVTELSDTDQHAYEGKAFLLSVIIVGDSAYYAWAPKMNEKWFAKLQQYQESGQGQIQVWLGTCKDLRWMAGEKAPAFYVVSKAKNPESFERLQQITQAPNQFSEIMNQGKPTKARWLIMSQTRHGDINAMASRGPAISGSMKEILQYLNPHTPIRMVKLNEEWLDELPVAEKSIKDWYTGNGRLPGEVPNMQQILKFMWNNAKPLE